MPTLRHLLAFLITSIVSVLTHYELAIYLLARVVITTFSIMLKQAREKRVRLIIQWLAGLGVVAFVGMVLLWSYALPQKSRLPETMVPVRFNAPISISHEARTWLTETDQLLQVLLWGPDLPPGAWLTTALLIGGVDISLWHADSRRLALYFLASLVFAYGAAGVGYIFCSKGNEQVGFWDIFWHLSASRDIPALKAISKPASRWLDASPLQWT